MCAHWRPESETNTRGPTITTTTLVDDSNISGFFGREGGVKGYVMCTYTCTPSVDSCAF